MRVLRAARRDGERCRRGGAPAAGRSPPSATASPSARRRRRTCSSRRRMPRARGARADGDLLDRLCKQLRRRPHHSARRRRARPGRCSAALADAGLAARRRSATSTPTARRRPAGDAAEAEVDRPRVRPGRRAGELDQGDPRPPARRRRRGRAARGAARRCSAGRLPPTANVDPDPGCDRSRSQAPPGQQRAACGDGFRSHRPGRTRSAGRGARRSGARRGRENPADDLGAVVRVGPSPRRATRRAMPARRRLMLASIAQAPAASRATGGKAPPDRHPQCRTPARSNVPC